LPTKENTAETALTVATTAFLACDPLTRLGAAGENAAPIHPLPQGGEGLGFLRRRSALRGLEMYTHKHESLVYDNWHEQDEH
jgi:hypothetical protein